MAEKERKNYTDSLRKAAFLAKVDFSSVETGELLSEVSKLVDYFGIIRDVDTEDIEPEFNGNPLLKSVGLVFDKTEGPVDMTFGSRELFLSEAPSVFKHHFRIPPVMQKSSQNRDEK